VKLSDKIKRARKYLIDKDKNGGILSSGDWGDLFMKLGDWALHAEELEDDIADLLSD
jgi:hypothetical protein